MPILLGVHYYVHLPLLIVLVSLVYGATRYDELHLILRESWRWGGRLLVFLFSVMFILFLVATIIP